MSPHVHHAGDDPDCGYSPTRMTQRAKASEGGMSQPEVDVVLTFGPLDTVTLEPLGAGFGTIWGRL